MKAGRFIILLWTGLVLSVSCCRNRIDVAGDGNSRMSRLASAPPTFRLIGSGTQGLIANDIDHAAHPDSFVSVAGSEAAYRQMWHDYIAGGDVPPVDFATETPVFLLLPSRPTGGYSIELRAVRLDKGVVVIETNLLQPKPRSIATQAFTAPWVVVAVKGREISEADWRADGSLIAAWKAMEASP